MNTCQTFSSNTQHTFVIGRDGSFYVWGENDYSQLGFGKQSESVDQPTKLEAWHPSPVVCFAAGVGTSALLTRDGHAYTWGYNTYGQLGHGHKDSCDAPKRLLHLGEDSDADPFVSIASGQYHSLGLTRSNKVFAWGRNEHGQVGHSGDDTPSPKQVPIEGTVVALACGYGHSVVLLEDGTMYLWGVNTYGQLGLGHTDTQRSPQFLRIAGGANSDTRVAQVACGASHTAFVMKDGSFWICGRNDNCELGSGDLAHRHAPIKIEFDTRILHVACGWGHNLVIDEEGALYGWGDNTQFQVGTKDSDHNKKEPVRIQLPFREDEHPSAQQVVHIGVGYKHSMAMTSDGSFFTWGSHSGELDASDTRHITRETIQLQPPLLYSQSEKLFPVYLLLLDFLRPNWVYE